MSTVLNIGDLSDRPQEQAVAAVRDAGPEFVLEVPLPHVNHSQSRLGPALDFLHALYIGETLRPLCESISHTFFRRDVKLWDDRRPEMSSHFLVRPRDLTAFAAKVHELALWFEPEDEALEMEKVETLDGYQNTVKDLLATGGIHFAELAEEYAENFRLAEAEEEGGE